MRGKCYRVLLIEDSAVDTQVVERMLKNTADVEFEIEHHGLLSTGLERLAAGGIDVILLDLTLPDSMDLDALYRVHDKAPNVPIVVLTANENDNHAVHAVQLGAEDYLVKGTFSGNLLVRAIRFAVERHYLYSVLHMLSMVDELTGLYNQRGFGVLGDQQLKLARRHKKRLVVGAVCLKGLEKIDDMLGTGAGNEALTETAEILRDTFRETDIFARTGRVEFAVLLLEVTDTPIEVLEARLSKSIKKHNKGRDSQNQLSISTGFVCREPKSPVSTMELIAEAEQVMLDKKKHGKSRHRKKSLAASKE